MTGLLTLGLSGTERAGSSLPLMYSDWPQGLGKGPALWRQVIAPRVGDYVHMASCLCYQGSLRACHAVPGT